GGGIVTEAAEHHGCFHHGILLFHATHHHAHVLGFDDHAHTGGVGNFHNGFCNLLGQVFLDLQTASIHIHNARDLGKPDHLARGNIGHMAFPDKGQQVVFTHGVKLDIVDQHHFAVV